MTSTPSALRRGRQWLAGLAGVLRHWPWFDTLRTLRQRFREDHLALTAGSLTFTNLVQVSGQPEHGENVTSSATADAGVSRLRGNCTHGYTLSS